MRNSDSVIVIRKLNHAKRAQREKNQSTSDPKSYCRQELLCTERGEEQEKEKEVSIDGQIVRPSQEKARSSEAGERMTSMDTQARCLVQKGTRSGEPFGIFPYSY